MKPDRKLKPVFWLRLVLATILSVYVGAIIFGAASIAQGLTAPLNRSICCQSPRDFGVGYENITFSTSDGLALSGWYVPSTNGAVVILLHSYYADRRQVLPVAAMLVRHGYGVLLYDQRASGESQGQIRSLGWLDIPDVAQAVAFVRSRPAAGNDPIGVYGCSVGGAIAVAAAAQSPSIAAVAADAPSPLTFDEAHPNMGDSGWAMNLPIYALYFSFIALRSGVWPPTATRQNIRHIAPRPLLLISTGAGAEHAHVDELYTLAGQPKTHWNIPDADHCGGPLVRPAEYERHLAEFFDATLLNH
jgi:pimeloyl-ACP methyl ester carboxylesterase